MSGIRKGLLKLDIRSARIYLLKRYSLSLATFAGLPCLLLYLVSLYPMALQRISGIEPDAISFGIGFTFFLLFYSCLSNLVYSLFFLGRADVCIVSEECGVFAFNKTYHLLSTRTCPMLMYKNIFLKAIDISPDGELKLLTSWGTVLNLGWFEVLTLNFMFGDPKLAISAYPCHTDSVYKYKIPQNELHLRDQILAGLSPVKFNAQRRKLETEAEQVARNVPIAKLMLIALFAFVALIAASCAARLLLHP